MTELGDDELTDVTGGSPSIIRPTPPIIYTRHWCGTGTRGSAIDACPSALGCTSLTLQEQTVAFQ